jgi:peptidoglycan/LPS O-acetylase OafA/YrhL
MRSGQGVKEVSLEAVRGIAAIVVVFWHSCLAFLPQHTGVFPQYDQLTWQGSPFFVFLNGQSAVALFFVLSAYVLTRRFFFSTQVLALVRGAVKRWPRFVGPIFVTVLTSYVLFRFNLYSFSQAGKESGSSWLTTFGWEFSDPAPNTGLLRALKEATYAVLFREEALFDTSLWTMHTEFVGSFIAFGMAPLLAEAKKIAKWPVWFLSGCVILIAANSDMPNLAAFPVGVTIAALLPKQRKVSIIFVSALLLTALYLLGYSGKCIGIYAAMDLLHVGARYTSYPAIAGAAIIICIFEIYEPLKLMFSGRRSRWLGEFSFPIYLMHALIICSLGSAVYLRYGTAAAFASVIIATPIVSFPLLLFDRVWVSRVNHVANLLIPRNPKLPESNAVT